MTFVIVPSEDSGDVAHSTNSAASICGVPLIHFAKSVFTSAGFRPQAVATVS